MLQCATESDDALYEQQVHTPAMLFKRSKQKLRKIPGVEYRLRFR
jgi:hypothetical protein